MPVVEIPEDSTATTLQFTFITNGSADDLSPASGNKYFHCRTVEGVAVVTEQTANFLDDGTDGVVETTMNSTIVSQGPRDLYCEFEIQGFGGGNLISYTFILRILKRAKGI